MSNTILVIEDNTEMLENIKSILELAHYQIITARNGKEGVVLAVEAKPDLVICDVTMPELDGFGVLHLLSKEEATSDIPFIFLTARNDRNDFRKGMNLGADDYITKPFDGLELLNAVEIRLKKNQNLNINFKTGSEAFEAIFTQSKKNKGDRQVADQRLVRKYKKKEYVYIEGQRPLELIFVKEGKVKTYKTNKDGKELIMGFHKAGDFIGYLPLIENTQYNETAVVLEDSLVYVISKQDFLTILYSNKDIARKFIKLLSGSLHEAEKRLIELAYQSVRQKVAGALLKLYDEYSNEGSKTKISVTRKDISNLIATATESLNRTLAEFKDEGIIDLSEDGIIIKDKTLIEKQLR
jgi:CRP-like cAMP-binding protein/ActR/RegA family two-component response regulator